METINTFWKKTRPTRVKDFGDSLTIPDLTVSISELLKSGKIEEVSNQIRKRMIYGNRIRIEDLTTLDYYRDKLKRYENLTRVRLPEQTETTETETETT